MGTTITLEELSSISLIILIYLKAVGDKSLSRICSFARLEELNIFNTSLSDESKVSHVNSNFQPIFELILIIQLMII